MSNWHSDCQTPSTPAFFNDAIVQTAVFVDHTKDASWEMSVATGRRYSSHDMMDEADGVIWTCGRRSAWKLTPRVAKNRLSFNAQALCILTSTDSCHYWPLPSTHRTDVPQQRCCSFFLFPSSAVDDDLQVQRRLWSSAEGSFRGSVQVQQRTLPVPLVSLTSVLPTAFLSMKRVLMLAA